MAFRVLPMGLQLWPMLCGLFQLDLDLVLFTTNPLIESDISPGTKFDSSTSLGSVAIGVTAMRPAAHCHSVNSNCTVGESDDNESDAASLCSTKSLVGPCQEDHCVDMPPASDPS